MRFKLLLICTILWMGASYAQKNILDLELRAGMQNIDQRSLQEGEMGDAFSATYLGLSAHRQIIEISEKSSLWFGLGLGWEQHNLNRIISSDFCRFCVVCGCISNNIRIPIESFRQYIIGMPIDLRHRLSERFSLRLEYRPDFVFLMQEIGGQGASESRFDLLDHNFRPSVHYQLGPCQFGLAANFRTNRALDPFYYEEFLRNGLIEGFIDFFDFGNYQPVRFDISVTYGL